GSEGRFVCFSRAPPITRAEARRLTYPGITLPYNACLQSRVIKGVWMKQYVALLRGINVGGKNIIRMAELRACFEVLDFANVRTYIQSGNVLFYADGLDRTALIGQIEDALSK